ncbi:hypothetical protein [Flavobacterium sp.]|uniref:hypothetical protein n=1 Tax=Flavobacterium sp. TaxID=239 RepID=UPI00286C9731|nr:hypothetical protein [Flavobacterium sp.]
MNANKFILIIALIATFVFSSCDDEPVDPQVLVESPPPCAEPFSFSVSPFIDGNKVRIEWDKTSGTGAWEIQYGIQGFSLGTGTTVNFNNASSLIGGLVSTIHYDFYIRTRCAAGQYSDWVGPVSPGSGVSSCADPTNLTAVRSATDETTATITWAAVGGVNSWQVQYGASGFVLGTGTILASSMPTKTISGLMADAGYEVYVRSNCAANQNSNWVGPVIIPPVGIMNDNSFFALMDGVEFVDVGAINVNPNSQLYGLPSIYIIATDVNNNDIEINISNDAVVGTEYFNTNETTDKFRFVFFKPLPTELQINTDGSLTVTERTATRIKGTFYFNAINEFDEITIISSGTFDVAIP